MIARDLVTGTDVGERGFATVLEVLSQREIMALLSSLPGLEHGRSRAGIRHILSNPAVKALANDPRLLQIARETLGANASPFRATLFDKSPASNWLITWHQDTALPLRERRGSPGWSSWSAKDGVIYAHAPASALQNVLALRVHLDDSTEQNGPLRVVPGACSRSAER